MWNPETFVSPHEGYISYLRDHYYVKRDGVRARNWEALEAEARGTIRYDIETQYWSRDIGSFYPLPLALAQKADFPPRPHEIAHYQQLSEQFHVWVLEYDQQERLIVEIHVFTGQEQRNAFEKIQSMDTISPQSIVYSTSNRIGSELPGYLSLQEYLDM